MGYKMPIVCKEIYLPIPSDEDISLEEYKRLYGIDLKEFLSFVGNEILIRFPESTKVFFVYSYPWLPQVGIPNNIRVQSYVAGTTDAYTQILYSTIDGEFGFGLMFKVDRDSDLTIENVTVAGYEI